MSTHDLLLAASNAGAHAAAYQAGYDRAYTEARNVISTQAVLRDAWHSCALQQLNAASTEREDDDTLLVRNVLYRVHFLNGYLDAALDRVDRPQQTRYGKTRVVTQTTDRIAIIDIRVDHRERCCTAVSLWRERSAGYEPAYKAKASGGGGSTWEGISAPIDILRFAASSQTARSGREVALAPS